MPMYADKSSLADSHFIRELMQSPLLEKELESLLIQKWQQDRDEDAMQSLIKAFSRLVVSIALRFRYYNIPFQDLIQEGILGVMNAADRFDLDKDVRFASYAKWWIRATIQDYVLKNWSIVKTGSTSSQKQLFFSLRRLKQQLNPTHFEEMKDEDRQSIAAQLHVSIQSVEDMEHRLAQYDYSLNQHLHPHNTIEWQDILGDTEHMPDHILESADAEQWQHFWIKTALAHLNTRERRVIVLRRLKDPQETLESVAKRLKISRERVRQIEAHALRKMKHALIGCIADVKDSLDD